MSRRSLTHSSYVRCVLAPVALGYAPSRQLARLRRSPIVTRPSLEAQPQAVEPGREVSARSGGVPHEIDWDTLRNGTMHTFAFVLRPPGTRTLVPSPRPL